MTTRILPLLAVLAVVAGALVLMAASMHGFGPCGAHCQWEMGVTPASGGLPFWLPVHG